MGLKLKAKNLFGENSLFSKVSSVSTKINSTGANLIGGVFGMPDLGTKIVGKIDLAKNVNNVIINAAEGTKDGSKFGKNLVAEVKHSTKNALKKGNVNEIDPFKGTSFGGSKTGQPSDQLAKAVMEQPLDNKPKGSMGIIAGGAAGFMVAGPIGAAIGALAGMFISKK